MTVVLFPSSSNVYQTMLHQLLWVCIVCVWKVAAYDFFQRECNIPQCNEIAEYLNNHVNVDEIACDNFLSYSCQYNTTGAFGGNRYVVRNDHYHQSSDFVEKEKYVLADTFHEILSSTIDERWKNPALHWEREVYANCRKNLNNRNDEYIKYKTHLDEAGRLDKDYHIDYYTNNTNEIVSWVIPDRKYANKGIGFAFFNVEIVTSQTDDLGYMAGQSKRYVQISPMSVNDPLDIGKFFTSYYKNSPTHATKYKSLGKLISDLNQIAPRKTDHEEDESKDVERYAISEWQTKWDLHSSADSHLNWLNHLNSIGLSLRASEEILVKNWAYFEHLAEIMHTTHMNAITDFVHLRYIMKTIGFVKPEYSQYSIIPEIKGFTCAPGLMVGVVHSFASKYFPMDNKRALEKMFNELRSNIKENLDAIGESSVRTTAATTKKFLRKLYASDVVIGYPDWVNDNITASFYTIRAVSEHYFQNQLYALESLLQRQVKSYTKGESLYEMDIYYKSLKQEDFNFDLTTNEIILPMSLFNEHDYKYFSSLLFYPINYASAGTSIAQKLYYKYLDEISYATQSDLPRCIESRASSLYNERRKNYILNSASWLLAVRDSFKTSPGLDGLPIHFRNFGSILPKHLFFVIFAQSLCKLPNSATEGPSHHINFALSNSRDFVRTFRCDREHKLYQSNSTRCEPLQQYFK
ncbi:uncharacterized protein LOC100677969 [Nasonia vitripennis]|uniref:Peptidase M13 N-terminal domain-containing protein n=1 Tax=Nasonia vitripennis TaxID=7425 RepID=A0A7M7QV88_NASVI|nr:uncharacterized protein LOC100677969 [Nasonia vitripennis]